MSAILKQISGLNITFGGGGGGGGSTGASPGTANGSYKDGGHMEDHGGLEQGLAASAVLLVGTAAGGFTAAAMGYTGAAALAANWLASTSD